MHGRDPLSNVYLLVAFHGGFMTLFDTSTNTACVDFEQTPAGKSKLGGFVSCLEVY